MALAGLIVLAILIVFTRFFYTPQKAQLAEIKTQFTTVQKERDSLKAEITILQAKKNASRPAVSAPSADLTQQILKGETPPDFSETSGAIEHMTRLASKRSIDVDSISSRPPEQKSGYKRVAIQMKAHGTFKSITALLGDFEEARALMVVDDLSISTESAVSGEMIIDLKASLFEVEGIHAKKD